MASLFPQTGGGGQTAAPVVQLRAGKCTLSAVQPNGKYTVTCDPRPGKIALVKGSDGLMHFKWLNGATNAVEDDRIVFPGEYTMKKVKTGRENCVDRVVMLKYLSGTQRLMYWLQDKSTEKDEDNIKKVNDFLQNPNAVVVDEGANAAPAAGSTVSPDEWMRLIGLNGGEGLPAPRAPAPSSAPAPAPAAAPFGNLDLSQILRTLAENNNSSSTGTAPAPASTAAETAPAEPSTEPNAEPSANPGGEANSGSGGDGNNSNNNSGNSNTESNEGGDAGNGDNAGGDNSRMEEG